SAADTFAGAETMIRRAALMARSFKNCRLPPPFDRFPLYNLMNNEDAFAQLTLTPYRKLILRTEAHSLNLANAKDLWYIGGGAFQKETFEAFIPAVQTQTSPTPK